MTQNIETRLENAVSSIESSESRIKANDGIIDEVVNSENEQTNPSESGQMKLTLKGVEVRANSAIADAVANTIDKSFVGEWLLGVTTFNSFNDYASFNGQTYKPKNQSGIEFPYVAQGTDPTQLPDASFIQPFSDVNSANVTRLVDSVIMLKLTDAAVGDIVETRSYYGLTPDDTAGSARYRILAAEDYSGVPDEYGDHSLVNGNVAKLIVDGPVNIRQFGAKSDSQTDNYNAITKAILYAVAFKKAMYVPEGVYLIYSSLPLYTQLRIFGDSDRYFGGGTIWVKGNVPFWEIRDEYTDGGRLIGATWEKVCFRGDVGENSQFVAHNETEGFGDLAWGVISGCKFHGFDDLYLIQTGMLIEKCEFAANKKLQMRGSDNYFQHNFAGSGGNKDVNEPAIHFNYYSNGTVTNNYLNGDSTVTRTAMRITGGTLSIYNGNNIELCEGSVIIIDGGARDVSISGNKIQAALLVPEPEETLIQIENSSRIAIKDNHILDYPVGHDLVEVRGSDCEDISVSNNMYESNVPTISYEQTSSQTLWWNEPSKKVFSHNEIFDLSYPPTWLFGNMLDLTGNTDSLIRLYWPDTRMRTGDTATIHHPESGRLIILTNDALGKIIDLPEGSPIQMVTLTKMPSGMVMAQAY